MQQAMLRGCRDAEAARELIARIEHAGTAPCATAYPILAEKLRAAGRHAEARAVLGEMADAACPSTPRPAAWAASTGAATRPGGGAARRYGSARPRAGLRRARGSLRALSSARAG